MTTTKNQESLKENDVLSLCNKDEPICKMMASRFKKTSLMNHRVHIKSDTYWELNHCQLTISECVIIDKLSSPGS